ncbi:MAG: oxygen-insensitive NAD(P)H nitroreductase [Rhodocyclaceae bacterium]|nr:oxygen-insensitive NAD(P)H nitroreductase [Rhodocyclaceae bacterium]
MTLVERVTSRRTCKAFDPARRVDAAAMEQLKTLLRFAPSSVNSQPWHFVIADSEAAKARITDTLQGGFAYNAAKARNASHLVVFCARRSLDEAHLAEVLAHEDAVGRFGTPEAKAGQHTSRNFYVGLHRDQLQDLDAWIDRQVYLALGTLLLGAAELGIDACPMEGIDCAGLDAALGLEARGLRSVVMVALGYRSDDDFNAVLPKSRLPAAAVITTL